MEKTTRISKVPIPFSQDEINQEIERVEDDGCVLHKIKKIGDSCILIFKPVPEIPNFGEN
jgi:hypothetical protein